MSDHGSPPSPYRIARQTTVESCERLLAIEPLLVGADEDLLAVAHKAVRQPQTRVLGVTDTEGRLIGILPVVRLAEDVVVRVDPGALMVDLRDAADVARFGGAVRARTVRDAMLPPAAVRPDATLAEAFRLMHKRHLSGLYVVTEDGSPSGYLDLLELTVLYLKALEAHGVATDPGQPATGSG